MKIDLIAWGDPADFPRIDWSLGELTFASYEPASAHRVIQERLQGDAEYLLFWDGALGAPSPTLIERLAASGDIIHAGLRVGTRGAPEDLDWVLAEWSLLDPPDDRRSNSWRVSLRCCLASTEVLRRLGGVDPAFASLDTAALELGFRSLRQGAVIWYEPDLVPAPVGVPALQLPLTDRYLFIRRTFGRFWPSYVQLCRSAAGLAPFRERRARVAAAGLPESPFHPEKWEWSGDTLAVSEKEPRVSVIIPTIGRYPYLPAALESIRRQTIRPIEVICVDQNDPAKRRPDVYAPYADLNLKVIWQDERGQSIARNAALEAATGDYVFLFDDDSVADPDALEQHLRVLSRYSADASTGVSYPPSPSDYVLPESFRFCRVAQTFDTGNAMITRRALQAAGGLDRAYDRGVNTDLDFATRLYLSGMLIVNNPHAKRIHYKAPSGGLRTYGSWWATSAGGLLRPFPAPTQLYYMFRFLSARQRRARVLLYALIALLGRDAGSSYQKQSKLSRIGKAAALLALLPLRICRSASAARRLLRAGPSIPRLQ